MPTNQVKKVVTAAKSAQRIQNTVKQRRRGDERRRNKDGSLKSSGLKNLLLRYDLYSIKQPLGLSF